MDAEAGAPLSSASLAQPPSEEWVRIYIHVTRNYLKSKCWKKLEGSIKFLDEDETLGDE